MAGYDDWEEGFRETFDDIPGIPFFRDYELDEAERLFDRGWVDSSLTPPEREAARDEFFDYTGLPAELFPWDEWREAMGYEDA